MNGTTDSVLPFTKLVTTAHVQVWIANLDQPHPLFEELAATLDAAERERASRITDDERRRRFVAGRGMLRELLGASTNTAPAKIQLTYGSHGKPELADAVRSEIHFNVSHSDDQVLYVVSRTRRVGIDIERIRPIANVDRLSRRFLSPSEQAALRVVPEDRRMVAFFSCWTLKEALVKGRGEGISDSFRRINVPVAHAEDARTRNVAGWALESLNVADGYAAAVAVEMHG
jgi:4'-phosphopantetheinyl transferase